MIKYLLIASIALLSGLRVTAQDEAGSDSTGNRSPLKTVSDKQYEALMKGADIYGMALPGTLNHYPLPASVLAHKNELNLGPAQLKKIAAIDKELTRKKLEMGQIILHNERTLDSIFLYKRLDPGSLIFFTNRYGLYQGELRNAILQACFATGNLLTAYQIKRLETLEKLK